MTPFKEKNTFLFASYSEILFIFICFSLVELMAFKIFRTLKLPLVIVLTRMALPIKEAKSNS